MMPLFKFLLIKDNNILNLFMSLCTKNEFCGAWLCERKASATDCLNFFVHKLINKFKMLLSFINKNLKSGTNSKGFTLVEVLISVTILATIAVVVSSSWGGNVIRLKSSKVKVTAVELLQRKILELEAEYSNQVDALPLEKQTGIFDDERFKDYTWQWEAQEINIPDISALVNTDGENALVVTVLENFRAYLNQSIKEVLVTVSYKRGKEKAYKFSVPFYIVNFDNQISMGISGADGAPLIDPNATQGAPGAATGGQ